MGAIAEGLARLDAGVSWTTLTTGWDDGGGWVGCSDLLDDPRRLLAWHRAVAGAHHRQDDAGLLTGQGLVLDWYLAAVTVPAVGLFHLDRRVPELAPGRLALRLDVPGSPPAATALEPGEFGCLPRDPAASEVGARVVDDLEALVTVLRTQLNDHAAHLMDAYAQTTRIGRHGLWAAVTDAVDVAFLVAGWVGGDMARAAADAAHTLGAAPLVGESTLHQIEDERGRSHWTRRRYSCCYLYRAPGQTACVTCPRVSAAERRRQAAHW
ncbi:MAG: (2Fe-2S)-binding protein [Nocardioidaceae bacterium]|nr:(2Fe-2S)-binding protein [Nocardioidaceae bacterium]